MLTWEMIIVALVVGASAAYLGWRLYGAMRGADGGCGGSCSCDSGGKDASRVLGRRVDLIQLGGEPGEKK